MNLRAIIALAATLIAGHCSNLDLLNKLENPGGISKSSSGETFTTNNYVFVSSWTTVGDMSNNPYVADCNGNTGANRADCACSRAAAMRGLRKSSTHVFRAWLSTSTSDAICRVQALGNLCNTNIPGNWFNTLGETIVTNYNGFAAATIPSAIRYDEFGVDQGPNLVWTGTNVGGTVVASLHCTDWTVVGGSGQIGDRTASTAANVWTQSTPSQLCNTAQRIYCVASP